MSTSTNSMPYPLVPQCLCTADCHIHHPSSHHCHSTYSIAHGARASIWVWRPVAQLLPRLQTPEQHGWTGTTSVDVASRARYDLLRLATTCYDLLRLGDLLHILYISSTLYTPSSVCLLNLLNCSVHFIRLQCEVLSHQFPGDCGCDLPTADPVPTLQWAAMHNPPVPGRSSRLVFQYRSILRKESQRNLERVQLWHALVICNLISQTDLNRKREKVKKLLEIIRSKKYYMCIYTYLYIYI